LKKKVNKKNKLCRPTVPKFLAMLVETKNFLRLRGAWTLSTGRGVRKVLKVEVKVVFGCFSHISNKIMAPLIASEASENKRGKNSVLGITKS